MKNKKILSLLIIGIIIAIVVGLYLFKPKGEPKTLQDQFKQWNLKAQGISGFKITERQKLSLDSFNVLRINAKNGSSYFKIEKFENIQQKKAKKYIEDQRLLLNSIFAAKPAPYPGAITNKIEPPVKFQPVYEQIKTKDFQGYAYKLYAGQRFNYGVTTGDLVYYRSIMAYLYSSKHNELYKFEFFVPKKKTLDTVSEFIINLSYLD